MLLLQALTRWAEPKYLTSNEYREAHSFLATSSRAPGLVRALRDSNRPFALWGQEDSRIPLSRQPAVTLTSEREGDAEGSVFIPESSLDVSKIPPITPFVRSRWRARYGLPDDLVVRLDETESAIPSELSETAMAVAAAVVVRGPSLAEALAWGAPTVTDEATASTFGVRDGVEVLVGVSETLDSLAHRLAGDAALAAPIARAGRRFAEERLDLGSRAAIVAESLGLIPTSSDPLSRVVALLSELWTPSGARIIDRIRWATN